MPLRITFNGTPWEVSELDIDLQSLAIDMGNTLTVKFGANLLAVSANPPVAPSGFTVKEVSATSVELRWSRSPNKEAQYDLYDSADGVTYSPIGSTANSVTFFSYSIDATVARYYKIIARNHFGESDPSILHYLPVLPPTSLNLTVVSDSEISITFTDTNNNGLGFIPERSNDGGTSWTTLSNISASPLDDTGLAAGTAYSYRFRAIGPNWNSYPSEVVSGTTDSGSAPNAPSLLVATAIDHQRIDLAWQDNSTDETSFEIERSLDGATGWTLVGTVSTNVVAYSDIHLLATTTYYYRARSARLTFKSTYSNTANATTPSDPTSTPNDPTNLTAQANGSTQISLAWTDNSDNETGFEIERRSPAGSGSFALIATTAAQATTYADTGLTPSTQYEYRVRAINGVLTSGYTNLASDTTPAGDAFGLTVTSAHPRILFNTSARMAQAQTWWQANSFVPGSDNYDKAHAYLMTGNATYLASVKTMLDGWFKSWAYQGTANQSGFVAVGASAAGLAPGATASDTYRWGEYIVPCLDWIWNGLTDAERTKYMDGYTMTWDVVGSAYFGQTVTVPGYTTICLVNMTRTWGGLTAPYSNYFWGCLRNELHYAILCYYERPSVANQILTFNFAATNSRWASALGYINTGGNANGGLPVEGSEYGPTMMYYPSMPMLTLQGYGRDLFSETSWFSDAMTHLMYSNTPKPTNYGGVNPDYYQVYPWSDQENGYGFPPANNSLYASFVQTIAIRYGTAAIAKYARYWLSLINPTVPRYMKAIDAGGTSLDWRTQNLAKTWRYPGADWYVRRTGWDTNETVWYLQGKTVNSGHGQDDNCTLQINRKGKWLSKESSGYGITFARTSFQTTVGASPTPTTTQFNLVNLPTTLTFYAVNTKIKFVTGALAGTTATVSSVVAATGVVTLSAALGQAPSAGDKVAMEFVGTGTRPTDRGATGAMAHSGLLIGMTGYATGGYRLAIPGVSTQFFNEQSGYAAIGYDMTNLFRGTNDPGHASQVPDYTTRVVREFYLLDALETVVQLDRVLCKTFGNSAFPQWADTVMPVHFFTHHRNAPVVDGANKWTHTDGTQVLRGITLLPTSPGYNNQPMTNFTGTHEVSVWYQNRLEMQDSGGAAQRYLLNVLQARDSTEADAVASITAEDAGTWTVSITHAKGNATLTLNKGATASQGTVTLG